MTADLTDHRNKPYDLADDPGELHNPADRYPERARTMQAQFFLWSHETHN